jgi:hypothetical protein
MIQCGPPVKLEENADFAQGATPGATSPLAMSAPIDPALARIVAAWAALPVPLRRAMLALIE